MQRILCTACFFVKQCDSDRCLAEKGADLATFSTSATELKYASGSSWSSGKARQGVYSSTRYEGAINFSG